MNGDSNNQDVSGKKSRISQNVVKAWAIGEQLKNNKAEDLFRWIGECIAEVVRAGIQHWDVDDREELPLGVTFSFPMMFVSLLFKTPNVLTNMQTTYVI